MVVKWKTILIGIIMQKRLLHERERSKWYFDACALHDTREDLVTNHDAPTPSPKLRESSQSPSSPRLPQIIHLPVWAEDFRLISSIWSFVARNVFLLWSFHSRIQHPHASKRGFGGAFSMN